MYLAPYEQFAAEAAEIEGMIKTVSAEIDAQVKAADEFRKTEKRRYIEEHIYAPIIGILSTLVPYEKLHDPKWLNVTTSPNEIRQAMAAKVEKIESGLKAIEQLGLDADIAERVNSVFMNTFDLAAAIAEKDRIMAERERMARYRAAQEAARQAQQAQQAQTAEVAPKAITAPAVEEKPAQPVEQPPADEKILTVKFCIHVTKAQLDGLGAYMRANGIKPERI
jgi:hypothetical protein